MYITEIFYNGYSLDLYADKGLRYNVQVNDIAEVKDRQATYTNSYSIPKTAKNVRILGGLGIASDTSRSPYSKPLCQVKIDGFEIIVKGWMSVKETEDEYKIYIYSGIIQFFKAIENKTLGKNLNLSEINHAKTPATVAASQTNEAYRYLIADFGGKFNTGTTGAVDSDYLMPCVNLKYLWDKIHDTFGFTYSCSAVEDMETLWMTYPKAKNVNDQLEEQAELKANDTMVYIPNMQILWAIPDRKHHFFNFRDRDVSHGSVIDYGAANPRNGGTVIPIYGHFVAPVSAYYKISISGRVKVPTNSFLMNLPQTLHLVKNAQNKKPVEALNQNNVIKSRIGLANMDPNGFDCSYNGVVYLNAGESMTLGFASALTAISWETDVNWTINRIENQEVSFTNELTNFSITDFFKEMLNIYGLTPFTNEHNNHIDYKTLPERLRAPVVDWTAKYIQRSSEKYIYNNYAQKNIFRYKYTERGAAYNDAALWINNLNLKDQTVVYDSIFYSPEEYVSTIKVGNLNINSNIFKMWDKEIKEDGSIEYKNKDNRFYILRSALYDNPITYTSGLSGETVNGSSFHVGSFTKVSLQYFVDNYYREFENITENSRLHTIDLHLNPIDMLSLDMFKIVYFAQEQQYYLLNKLKFDGDKQEGDFIRIVRPYDIVDPVASDSIVAVTYNSKATWDQTTADHNFTLAELDIHSIGYTKFKVISVPLEGFLHTTNFTAIQVGHVIEASALSSGALKFKGEGAYNNMSTMDYTTSFIVQGIYSSGASGEYINIIINAADLLDGDDSGGTSPVNTYCFRAYKNVHIGPSEPYDPSEPSYDPSEQGTGSAYPPQSGNYGEINYVNGQGAEETIFISWQDGIVQIQAQAIIFTSGVHQVTCP